MTSIDLPPWGKDWANHIREAVNQLGYPSFLEFIQAHVGQPYGKLLRAIRMQLGYMVPMMQVHKLHMLEAIVANRARDAAKDSLVRALREHLPKGWNKGKNAREKRARAFAEWVLPYQTVLEMEQITAIADKIWEELETMQPSPDWRPDSPNDPIIEKAFSKIWAEENK